jgi:pyruvate-ferredoxin/flavodoxin oxidoreductase
MAGKKNFVTCDGNYAAAHIAYMFSEVSAIYPITPSSTMAEYIDEWSAQGRKNIFGEKVKVTEMQSEAGAAGAMHGSLQSGALTTTFTASQGLLLMIPNMYKISGELLPGVFHVSARSLAAQALSIFGDHSDVMSTRHCGFAMLASGTVQEIMDIGAVAHLTSIKSRIPFLHFFDGFRTSHEIQKVEAPSTEQMEKLMDWDALQRFRDQAINPEHPVTRGTAQNPDIYFQSREASNKFYLTIPDMVEEYMQEMSKMTGREYHPFTYYGAPDAENIIIAIGSVTSAIKETIDYLAKQGKKVGLISVHLYRPFSAKYLLNVLPDSVKRIAVLDRTKEPGANGEPLYLDVCEVFYGRKNAPLIVNGRYGLSSKDTTPAQIVSVYENLEQKEPKKYFTIGIVDDVTYLSLPLKEEIAMSTEGTFEGKFYGIGADGTVGANKNSIKIIGDSTDKYAQAYFAYDSKKSGGVTTSHLRFGDKPIQSSYLVNTPDFVACHVPSYLGKYDVLKGIKENGTFLLNSIWDAKEIIAHLPNSVKIVLAKKKINFYIINATKIGREIGLGNRINFVMQSAFFKISNVIPYENAVAEMKKAITKSFSKKGEEIVKMNHTAVDRGGDVEKVNIDAAWAKLTPEAEAVVDANLPAFITDVVNPINALKGDDLPVSAFTGREDGTFDNGTTQYEKRGVAAYIPEWQAENCIQCNQCAFVCPHACIRPFLLDDNEASQMPKDATLLDAKGKGLEGLKYRIQISPLDCTGCNVCVEVCPSKEKSLVMKALESQKVQEENWNYVAKNVKSKTTTVVDPKASIKNSQFAQPLFEFSGACAGCGETAYIKLITQLFGDRMMVANATGCSSIYGGSAPSTPYCTNEAGEGPAWANSLFEDNAEFGLGMSLGVNKMRTRIEERMTAAISEKSVSDATIGAFKAWIEAKEDASKTKEVSANVVAALKNEKAPVAKEILNLKQYLVKKSQWIFGGDGWAYDIGFGGLDHVLASGEDVNILVMDTEVYSNTGGQASKSTPVGAVAKFAAAGKQIRKKDLGAMMMTYGYVYVAQVSMGANMNQYMTALKEAEAYPGPSLIITYSPCINHGIKGGMGKSIEREKKAVESGYWHMYRFNPMLEAEGKNPFQLDSKQPDYSKFQDFLKNEVRYTSLVKAFPAEAARLFTAAEENAKWRYESYKRRGEMDYTSK